MSVTNEQQQPNNETWAVDALSLAGDPKIREIALLGATELFNDALTIRNTDVILQNAEGFRTITQEEKLGDFSISLQVGGLILNPAEIARLLQNDGFEISSLDLPYTLTPNELINYFRDTDVADGDPVRKAAFFAYAGMPAWWQKQIELRLQSTKPFLQEQGITMFRGYTNMIPNGRIDEYMRYITQAGYEHGSFVIAFEPDSACLEGAKTPEEALNNYHQFIQNLREAGIPAMYSFDGAGIADIYYRLEKDPTHENVRQALGQILSKRDILELLGAIEVNPAGENNIRHIPLGEGFIDYPELINQWRTALQAANLTTGLHVILEPHPKDMQAIINGEGEYRDKAVELLKSAALN